MIIIVMDFELIIIDIIGITIYNFIDLNNINFKHIQVKTKKGESYKMGYRFLIA